MILQDGLPKCLIKVDPPRLESRPYLQPSDDCYFFGEYTARKGPRYSPTNQWIFNFKKPLNHRGQRYKKGAIEIAAQMFRQAIESEALDRTTFVPIPSSKCKDDPSYDDRLLQMLKLIQSVQPLDIRELLVQSRSVEADHESDNRKSLDELRKLWKVDDSSLTDAPNAPLGKCLAIVDDLLITGAHFRAAESLLSRFNVKIVGFFLALGVKARSSPKSPKGTSDLFPIPGG